MSIFDKSLRAGSSICAKINQDAKKEMKNPINFFWNLWKSYKLKTKQKRLVQKWRFQFTQLASLQRNSRKAGNLWVSRDKHSVSRFSGKGRIVFFLSRQRNLFWSTDNSWPCPNLVSCRQFQRAKSRPTVSKAICSF